MLILRSTFKWICRVDISIEESGVQGIGIQYSFMHSSELSKIKLVCILFGKPFSLLQRSALAVDLPHFVLIIAEAAIQSIWWLIIHTLEHTLEHYYMAGQTDVQASFLALWMIAAEHSAFFPLLMDIADANATFKRLQIMQTSSQEFHSHLPVETERSKTLVTLFCNHIVLWLC